MQPAPAPGGWSPFGTIGDVNAAKQVPSAQPQYLFPPQGTQPRTQPSVIVGQLPAPAAPPAPVPSAPIAYFAMMPDGTLQQITIAATPTAPAPAPPPPPPPPQPMAQPMMQAQLQYVPHGYQQQMQPNYIVMQAPPQADHRSYRPKPQPTHQYIPQGHHQPWVSPQVSPMHDFRPAAQAYSFPTAPAVPVAPLNSTNLSAAGGAQQQVAAGLKTLATRTRLQGYSEGTQTTNAETEASRRKKLDELLVTLAKMREARRQEPRKDLESLPYACSAQSTVDDGLPESPPSPVEEAQLREVLAFLRNSGTDSYTMDLIKMSLSMGVTLQLRDLIFHDCIEKCGPIVMPVSPPFAPQSRNCWICDDFTLHRGTVTTALIEILARLPPSQCVTATPSTDAAAESTQQIAAAFRFGFCPIMALLFRHFDDIRPHQRGCIALLRSLVAVSTATRPTTVFVRAVTLRLPDMIFNAHANFMVSNILSNFLPIGGRNRVCCNEIAPPVSSNQVPLNEPMFNKDEAQRTTSSIMSLGVRARNPDDAAGPESPPPSLDASQGAKDSPPSSGANSTTGTKNAVIQPEAWDQFITAICEFIRHNLVRVGTDRTASHVFEAVINHVDFLQNAAARSLLVKMLADIEGSFLPLCLTQCGHFCALALFKMLHCCSYAMDPTLKDLAATAMELLGTLPAYCHGSFYSRLEPSRPRDIRP